MSSPAITNKALLLSLMIDAYEGRDVVTATVAGVYLRANMPNYVLLQFKGNMIDIM